MIHLSTYRGPEIEPFFKTLAALRISVFKEFPYLYEGSLDYEMEYLKNFARAEHSTLVLARSGDQVVGASTALPLIDAEDAFQKPFREAHLDPRRFYYFGESVLLPEFRGHGTGHRFFDERERSASALGFAECCFCAVVRPESHPLRPAHYKPLDAFWKKRGYRVQPGLVADYPWTDFGDESETSKSLQFWTRATPL